AVAHVAGGAAVDAAAHGFQLVDDFHGADFGRAGQRAGRESRPQHVDVAHAVVQFAAHVGHQVHDVGIALDGHGVRDLDRAGLGNAADVVAGQVDEHDVF